MSLFSGDCQELAPCAVPVHHNGDKYDGPAATTTSAATTGSTTATIHYQQQCKNEPSTAAERRPSSVAVGNQQGEPDPTGLGTSGSGGRGADSEHNNEEAKISPAPPSSVTRVFKKCASNGSVALYVGSRTVTIEGTHLEPLKGIIVLDKESLQQTVSDNFRIWGQITLTFRYGREDEEVLGLRFCNEAILALKQLWPPLPRDPEDIEDDELTPLQGVLMDRVNSSANSPSIHSVPFTLCAGPVGIGAFPPPPSVLLAPAKPYKGSPIGTLYDLRIYASERPEERPPRRNTIRLALRAVQTPPTEVTLDLQGTVESRPTILSRGKIKLQCELSTNAVRYGESLDVKLSIENNSRSSIRRILVSLIQQVDVCMFTSGKFKNIVGCAEDNIFLVPGASYQKRYTLTPQRGPARQWLALEEAFGREPVLAPSTSTDNLEPTVEIAPQKGSNRSRNVFAIIVSYYVKAKLILGGLALCQSLKVPFVLLPPLNPDDPDPYPGPATTTEINFNPSSIITSTSGTGTPNKNVPGSSSPVASHVCSTGGPSSRREDEDENNKTSTKDSKKPTTISSTKTTSASSNVPSSIVTTAQQHQPQVCPPSSQHLESEAAIGRYISAPSPVRVPSVEHLF